jgi:predicted transcriptional regulator
VRDYEAKIKLLEEQIGMLKSESGDVVQQLEKRIRELVSAHEQEKEKMAREAIRQLEDAKQAH